MDENVLYTEKKIPVRFLQALTRRTSLMSIRRGMRAPYITILFTSPADPLSSEVLPKKRSLIKNKKSGCYKENLFMTQLLAKVNRRHIYFLCFPQLREYSSITQGIYM